MVLCENCGALPIPKKRREPWEYYPAIFIQRQDGHIDVYFPDVPGLISQGDGMGDAIAMAQEGLALHLGTMIEDNDPLPSPSTIKEALAKHMAEREQRNASLEECVCQFVPYIPSLKKKKDIRASVHLS